MSDVITYPDFGAIAGLYGTRKQLLAETYEMEPNTPHILPWIRTCVFTPDFLGAPSVSSDFSRFADGAIALCLAEGLMLRRRSLSGVSGGSGGGNGKSSRTEFGAVFFAGGC